MKRCKFVNQAALMLAGVAIAVSGCERDRSQRIPSAEENGRRGGQSQSVGDVMRVKLAHAQAVLEGIALADFRQIEAHAQELNAISRTSDWMVHESVAYHAFSEDFRKVTVALAGAARAEDLERAVRWHAHLTNSCVACHTYIRQERITRDVPGRVSWLSDTP